MLTNEQKNLYAQNVAAMFGNATVKDSEANSILLKGFMRIIEGPKPYTLKFEHTNKHTGEVVSYNLSLAAHFVMYAQFNFFKVIADVNPEVLYMKIGFTHSSSKTIFLKSPLECAACIANLPLLGNMINYYLQHKPSNPNDYKQLVELSKIAAQAYWDKFLPDPSYILEQRLTGIAMLENSVSYFR